MRSRKGQKDWKNQMWGDGQRRWSEEELGKKEKWRQSDTNLWCTSCCFEFQYRFFMFDLDTVVGVEDEGEGGVPGTLLDEGSILT